VTGPIVRLSPKLIVRTVVLGLIAWPLVAQDDPEPMPGGSGALGTFASVTCEFEQVAEVDQPARRVTIRRGAEAPSEGAGDGAPVYAWVEKWRPILPVWSATVERSGTVTVQSRTADGIASMLTFRPDGQAVLSTHDTDRDPSQIIWSAVVGRCVVVE
jgi:hypothetical protein